MSRSSPKFGKKGSPGSETASTGQGFGFAWVKRRKSCASAAGRITRFAWTLPGAKPAVGPEKSPARIRRRSRLPASTPRSNHASITQPRRLAAILQPICRKRQFLRNRYSAHCTPSRRNGSARVLSDRRSRAAWAVPAQPVRTEWQGEVRQDRTVFLSSLEYGRQSRCLNFIGPCGERRLSRIGDRVGDLRHDFAQAVRRVHTNRTLGRSGALLCRELCLPVAGVARDRAIDCLC